MIARIKTRTPSSACSYYTSGRDYEVLIPRWSGKLAQALEIDDQPINQACLEQLTKGRNPHGEVLVDKTRLHRRQENAIAAGQKPPKERAGEDLILNAPKSVSLEILVFGNRDLELAHQLANTRTLQLVEERYTRTRIAASGHQISVATGSLIVAQFDHGTNRRLEPHRHTHNLILNLQQHPDTQRWQTFDNAALRSAEKWIGQIYRNELAYLAQTMGYRLQVIHQDGRWELSDFSPKQLRAFSQRSVEIEAAVGIAATPQQKQFANIITRPSKPDSLSTSDIEREWQRQSVEIGLQRTYPGTEIAEQNARAQQQAIIQFLMWLNQTFDRRAQTQQTRSPSREEIERFSLCIPGQFSFQELQQAIDRYCPPFHSGAFSNYVRGTSADLSESQPSATNSISTEPEYRGSTAQSCDIPEHDAPERSRADSDGSNPTDSISWASAYAVSDSLTFYNFSHSSRSSSATDSTADSTTQFEQPGSERPSSSYGTPPTSTQYSDSSAVRGTEAAHNAPNSTDAANGRNASQHLSFEEEHRPNIRDSINASRSNQQRADGHAQRNAGDAQGNADLPALDRSRTNRHQEQSENVSNPEAVWLEDSRLEVER